VLKPADPWSDHVNRGNAWSALGNYESALKDYDTALKLKADFDQAYYNRGIVYEKQGKITQAREEFVLAYKAGLRSRGLIERMNVHGILPEPSERLSLLEPVRSMDVFRGVIAQIGDTENGRGLCFGPGASVGTVRPVVEAQLERAGVRGLPTPNQVIAAMHTAFACPFAPDRAELKPATASEVEGVWLFPEESQKLRYPPKSSAWSGFRALPIKCEGVSYYPGGEARTVQIAGANAACSLTQSSDLDGARKNPRVSDWALSKDGRLVITRTDVQGHIEEWDLFTVTAPFTFGGIQFNKGELVGYVRKERGNDSNMATQFRHLRRLP
jgi:hypothetical protein